MTQKIILFADNDPDFLQTRAEFLQKEGYLVVFAYSPVEAEHLMQDLRIHLAILDIRLSDDDDEKDISGSLLAQKVEFRNIPKIMLTGKPSAYTSRDSLRQHPAGFFPAINYLLKEEGPLILIGAVNEAFANNVYINWNLTIDWNELDPMSLVKQIDRNMDDRHRFARSQELEDLFRRLFYEENYIRIERNLWRGDGRLALVVFSTKEGMGPKSYIVICGSNSLVTEEARLFETISPRDSSSKLIVKTETMHYAGNAYTFANIDLEHVQSLNDFYHSANSKLFSDTLVTLFQKTLAEWHQDSRTHVETSAQKLYQQRLKLIEPLISKADFEEKIIAVEKKALNYDLTIRHSSEEVSFEIDNKILSYPNPFSLLFKDFGTGGAFVINAPGQLTGQNILTDGDEHTWLTDFATAGQVPRFWNYVTIESIIRFVWTDAVKFSRLEELEVCLINSDFFKPDIQDLEVEVHKPAQAIKTLRGLIRQEAHSNTVDYHLGVFYQAARIFLDIFPTSLIHQSELMRLVHIYLSLAMLARKIINLGSDGGEPKAHVDRMITIADKKARLIRVGSRSIRLTQREYSVFEYLFHKAGEVCTKEELVNSVNMGGYSEDYAHKIVSEIRKKIEDDPKRPSYLINEPYAGYRLIINPI